MALLREHALQVFLRVVGSVALLAVLAVVMPMAWMAEIHKLLGLGTMPEGPIVGYLARSTSAFYAIFGAILWRLSFDLKRFLPMIRFVGGAAVFLGVSLLVIDAIEGLPIYWVVGEGIIDVGIGAMILFLARGNGSES
jgi:hypothetical protein